MANETDLELSDGRTLHFCDASVDGADASLAVFWHHGTPNIGAPPEPLLLHGGQDRIAPSSHAEWLARHIRSAELRLRPDDGHVSVLNAGAAALDWLREHANQGLARRSSQA